MAVAMKENGSKIKKMDSEYTHGFQGADMRDSSRIVISMGKERSSGPMAKSITENGSIIIIKV